MAKKEELVNYRYVGSETGLGVMSKENFERLQAKNDRLGNKPIEAYKPGRSVSIPVTTKIDGKGKKQPENPAGEGGK